MTPKKQKADDKPTTMATTAKPETPKAEAAKPPAAQPQPQPTATKQSQTVAKLKTAWLEKGLNLDKLVERQDGKFVILQPTPEWPIIRVGPTGGLELPQIRSYARALDAAIDGLAVWQKQQARDTKKATAMAAPAPAQTTKPQSTSATKPETPAAKKQKASAAIEAQLEARA